MKPAPRKNPHPHNARQSSQISPRGIETNPANPPARTTNSAPRFFGRSRTDSDVYSLARPRCRSHAAEIRGDAPPTSGLTRGWRLKSAPIMNAGNSARVCPRPPPLSLFALQRSAAALFSLKSRARRARRRLTTRRVLFEMRRGAIAAAAGLKARGAR